jgi:hypothetical protein
MIWPTLSPYKPMARSWLRDRLASLATLLAAGARLGCKERFARFGCKEPPASQLFNTLG